MDLTEEVEEEHILGLIGDGRGIRLADNNVPAGLLINEIRVSANLLMQSSSGVLVKLVTRDALISY